ncbi:MAG: tRNA (adenosine(37)-N6)-dimethylallyltransferase MiaA [Cytophagaceae bacterium]|nr:tRNA (adenosine(37)-N6)-dimethylallyltransferase MiaA [Cytophagaceae bacterium]
MSASQKTLLVIAGPTAVGKTALCVRLAQELKTDVVSADSRQFYRELTIGTAKPSLEEMGGVRHHFIDSHSIAETYTAGMYEADCLRCLAELFQKKDVVILTGGSGLFLKVITDGLDEMPPAVPEIREALQAWMQQDGLPALVEELRQSDPVYCEKVDKKNPQRIIRALEVCRSTGQPYSDFRRGAKVARPFQSLKICLTRDRDELYARIDSRMDAMLAAGLIDEVRPLLPYRHHNPLQTVGYQEVFPYLDGLYDYAELVRLLKRNSRRYAKRQLTWFRNQGDYEWIDPKSMLNAEL